jgi:hypothetical protein
MGFHHLSGPPTSLDDTVKGPGPWVKQGQGIPVADKHRLLWAWGSGGLRRLARRDVVVGTHAHLSVCTRVWNPSHHFLTKLSQEYMPKGHDDSARG